MLPVHPMREKSLNCRPARRREHAGVARGSQGLRASSLLALVLAAGALAACPGSSDDDGGGSSGGTSSSSGGPSGAPKWVDVAGDRQGPLPQQSSARSSHFVSGDQCAQCHLAGDGPAVRDAKGRDVSPVGTFKASAMALAARDPYYLAAVADELQFRPNLASTVEKTCTRCHAPEASVELEVNGKYPTFSMLTTGADTSNEAHLGREGVGCSLCHQITDENLGKFPSFTGGFVVGELRQIYGPYANPVTDPMRTLVNFTPTYAPHIGRSSLCATCHTVITKPRDSKGNVGPDFPEQVPYLEWLASAFTTEDTPGEKAATCQECHMFAADDDGAELSVAISRTPAGLAPRKPFRRHGFQGANVQLSRFAASDPSWLGVPLTKEDHEAQARSAEDMIRRGAKVEVASVTRSGEGVDLQVKVTNLSGHKFPTGYPSRRAFLHVKVEAGGSVAFESGRADAFGRLVGRDGAVIEAATFAPHLDVVDREDAVQIYESVPVDVNGKLAHRPLDAHHYAKDNRLVPYGFNRRNSNSAYTAPVGTDSDPDWGASDVVKYRIAKAPPGATITVELLFQTIRPSDVEFFASKPTPMARKLFDMTIAAPLAPVVVSAVTSAAP